MKQKLHLFWGGPFSNWLACTFTVDGVTYNSAEQFMMAEKAKLFKDEESLVKIMNSKDPREQKALGRKVKGFVPSEWDAVSRDRVYVGVLAKFQQSPRLKAFILSTGDEVLVEASPFDKIWGIGLSVDDPRAQDPAQWLGLNYLGEVLMRVRETLKNE